MLTWALMWGMTQSLKMVTDAAAKTGGGEVNFSGLGCYLFLSIPADAAIFYMLYLVAMAIVRH